MWYIFIDVLYSELARRKAASKLLKEKQAEDLKDRTEETLSNICASSELGNQQSSDK